MNILVLGMNYHPELTGIGTFTTSLCEHLARNGTTVNMITAFPHYPYWRIYDGYKKKYLQKEWMKKVRLLRTYVYIPKRHSAIKRVLYDFSLTFTSMLSGALIRHYDVVLCISPPLTLGLSAYLLSRLRDTPFVFHIQDLVPDAAIEVGMLKPGRAVNFARRIEKFIYEKSAAIGVISPGIAQNLHAKGVPASKIHYLPNWIDLEFIRPMDRNNGFREQNHLSKQDFVVMYAGNIGNKQGLEVLIDSASLLREKKQIRFYIVGEGSCKADLVQKAKRLNLPNLQVLTLQPKDMLPSMLSAADILVLTQQAGVTDFCFPGKLLTYMASATPLVAAINQQSETGRAISEAHAGIIVSPQNSQAITEAILKLHRSASLRRKYGANGRAYVSDNFEKSKVLTEFENMLLKIARKQNPNFK